MDDSLREIRHDCDNCPEAEDCQTKDMLNNLPPGIREEFNSHVHETVNRLISKGLVTRCEDGRLLLTNEGYARLGIGVN